MQTWWNRWAAKVRAPFNGSTHDLGGNGTVALVAGDGALETSATLIDEHANGRSESHGFAQRLRDRIWSGTPRVSVRDQLETAVARLTQLCESFEEHLVRQQARMDEIAAGVRKLSAELPSAAVDQRRQVEQIGQAIAAHRSETGQLASLLADVPATLTACGNRVASQGEALGKLVEHAGTSEQVQSDIRERMATIVRTHERVEMFVGERRRVEEEMRHTLSRTTRRLTAMVGVAIGLATASAAFGVIQLFLRLGG